MPDALREPWCEVQASTVQPAFVSDESPAFLSSSNIYNYFVFFYERPVFEIHWNKHFLSFIVIVIITKLILSASSLNKDLIAFHQDIPYEFASGNFLDFWVLLFFFWKLKLEKFGLCISSASLAKSVEFLSILNQYPLMVCEYLLAAKLFWTWQNL